MFLKFSFQYNDYQAKLLCSQVQVFRNAIDRASKRAENLTIILIYQLMGSWRETATAQESSAKSLSSWQHSTSKYLKISPNFSQQFITSQYQD